MPIFMVSCFSNVIKNIFDIAMDFNANEHTVLDI